MINNPEIFNQVAVSLANHYMCVYYVNIDTNHYTVFADSIKAGTAGFPSEGEDFFSDCRKNAGRFVHPDDLEVLDYGTKSVLSGKAEVQPIRYRARKKDGTYVVLHTRGFVLTDGNGNPDYFGGIIVHDD